MLQSIWYTYKQSSESQQKLNTKSPQTKLYEIRYYRAIISLDRSPKAKHSSLFGSSKLDSSCDFSSQCTKFNGIGIELGFTLEIHYELCVFHLKNLVMRSNKWILSYGKFNFGNWMSINNRQLDCSKVLRYFGMWKWKLFRSSKYTKNKYYLLFLFAEFANSFNYYK